MNLHQHRGGVAGHNRRSGFRMAFLGLALAAALAVTSVSSAQFGRGSMRDMFEPDLSRRELPLLAEGLQLDEQQKFIIEGLLEQYRQDIQAGVDSLREGWMTEEFQEASNDQQRVTELIFGKLSQWSQKKRSMTDQLVADIKGLLNANQLERWPTVERSLLRQKTLTDGRLSGESLDLFIILDREIGVPPMVRQTVQPVLDQYELQLDQALRQRNTSIEEVSERQMQAIQNPEGTDFGAAVEKLIRFRVMVRDTNLQFAEAITAALPADLAEKFRTSVREKAFSRVYRTTYVERMLQAAKEIEGLDPSVLSSIDQIQQNYTNEIGAVNTRLVDLIKEQEPKTERQKIDNQFKRMRNQPVEREADMLRAEYRKREEIGQKYIDQMQSLLTPDQLAMLPGNKARTVGATLGDVSPTVRTDPEQASREERGSRGERGGRSSRGERGGNPKGGAGTGAGSGE